jgi:hypothetical protein
MENLAERSGPKRHTLIEHYKGSLTCMECGIVYTQVPIMVYDQAFLLWPDYPSTRELPPIRHPGTRWAALWDRALVTLTSTQFLYWKLAFMNSRKIESIKNYNTSCKTRDGIILKQNNKEQKSKIYKQTHFTFLHNPH